jgi:hypothetical protein
MFTLLPLELQQDIVLRLDVKAMFCLCLANKTLFRDLFQDESFWKKKRIHDFGDTRTLSQKTYYQQHYYQHQQQPKRLVYFDVYYFDTEKGVFTIDLDLEGHTPSLRKFRSSMKINIKELQSTYELMDTHKIYSTGYTTPVLGEIVFHKPINMFSWLVGVEGDLHFYNFFIQVLLYVYKEYHEKECSSIAPLSFAILPDYSILEMLDGHMRIFHLPS